MSERSAPALEVRLAGRTLRGVAIRYGERSLDRAEVFEPGAFAGVNGIFGRDGAISGSSYMESGSG